jgi:hypothetical protein
MSFFKIMENPLKLCAKIDFSNEQPDSFDVTIFGQVGEEIIDFNEIYETAEI